MKCRKSFCSNAAEALRRAYQRANAAGVDIELARQAALYGKGVEVIYADGEAQRRTLECGWGYLTAEAAARQPDGQLAAAAEAAMSRRPL